MGGMDGATAAAALIVPWRFPVVGSGMAVLVVLAYGGVLALGATGNAIALFELGAFQGEAVRQGDWYRPGTGMLLSNRFGHAFAGAFGLFVTSGFVETMSTRTRAAAVLLVAGPLGLLAVGVQGPDLIAAGASAGTSGLMGAAFAWWLRTEDRWCRQARAVPIAVALAGGADLAFLGGPRAISAHAFGFVLGFAVYASTAGRVGAWLARGLAAAGGIALAMSIAVGVARAPHSQAELCRRVVQGESSLHASLVWKAAEYVAGTSACEPPLASALLQRIEEDGGPTRASDYDRTAALHFKAGDVPAAIANEEEALRLQRRRAYQKRLARYRAAAAEAAP